MDAKIFASASGRRTPSNGATSLRGVRCEPDGHHATFHPAADAKIFASLQTVVIQTFTHPARTVLWCDPSGDVPSGVTPGAYVYKNTAGWAIWPTPRDTFFRDLRLCYTDRRRCRHRNQARLRLPCGLR